MLSPQASLMEMGDYQLILSKIIGVATGFVHLITPLETWDAKLGILASSSSAGRKSTLPDSDWIK